MSQFDYPPAVVGKGEDKALSLRELDMAVRKAQLDNCRPPLLITIMLACYYSPNPSEEVGVQTWFSPAGCDFRAWLKDRGLIDGTSRATDKGRAWVDGICNTPLPVAKWEVPERK